MEVSFKFKKGDTVKRTDINYSPKYEITGAIQVKHVDWNVDGETMTWKVENRYYLKDVLGRQLDETVSEVWLKKYEEKSKEKNQNLPKKVYVIRATVPFADSYIIGFSYDEDTAIKNKETLESVRKAEIFRVEKIDLME